MKIAFLLRVDAAHKHGGDVQQVKHYISHLKNAYGVDSQIITNFDDDLSKFDVFHLTNIDRPVDAYCFFKKVVNYKKPIFISTIHHSYCEIEKYEKNGRRGLFSVVSRYLSFQNLEILRSLARCIQYKCLIVPTLQMLFVGVKNAQKEILKGVDKIVVLTDKEKNDIENDFDISISNVQKIPNGINPPVFFEKVDRDLDVLVVGRIEARKNQIEILRVLDELKVKGVFVGALNGGHLDYCREFLTEIKKSKYSEYVGAVEYSEMVNYYRRSKVHVSASWFEVLSLVDLEAAASGCYVVSSKCGGTNEFVHSGISFVAPDSISDLKNAVIAGLSSPLCQQQIINKIGETWGEVVDKLYKCYLSVNK